MFHRAFGIIIILVGIVGLILAALGAVFGFQAIEAIGGGLDSALALTSDALTTTKDTLELTKTTVDQATEALDTVAVTAANLSTTVSDSQPLLDQINMVLTTNIPDSLEAVQGAIPNTAAVAATIDRTLATLSSFSIEQRILGVPIAFDLGIDYNPEEPFDQTILALGDSLEGVPENLRALGPNLTLTSDNMGTVSDNILQISDNLATINGSIAEIGPLLDDYIDLVDQIIDQIDQARANISNGVTAAKIALTVIVLWFGLYQIVPLHMGWHMLTDSGEEEEAVEEKEEEEAKEDREKPAEEEPDDEGKDEKDSDEGQSKEEG